MPVNPKAISSCPSHNGNASPSSRGKRGGRDEPTTAAASLSFLLLLLSAVPLSPSANVSNCGAVNEAGASPFSTSYRMHSGSSTPFLAYVAQMQAESARPAPLYVKNDDDSDESGDVTEEQSSSSDSEGASSRRQIVVRDSCIGRIDTRSCVSAIQKLDLDQLHRVMAYLPFATATACLRVSRHFSAAAARVVTRPLSTATPTLVFLPWVPPPSTTSTSAPPPLPANKPAPTWQCGGCSGWNLLMAESCRHCGGCTRSSQRVFVGQLRKEHTAEMAGWLIRSVCPDVAVVHIESHTNPTDGRGKGCAWVYVERDADVEKLLTLSKRIFMDVNDDGEEGVWLCAPNEQPGLAAFAAQQAYIPFRPIQLPRQPVVVERPKNGAGGGAARGASTPQVANGGSGGGGSARKGSAARGAGSGKYAAMSFAPNGAALSPAFFPSADGGAWYPPHMAYSGGSPGFASAWYPAPQVGVYASHMAHGGYYSNCYAPCYDSCGNNSAPAGATSSSPDARRFRHDPYNAAAAGAVCDAAAY